MALQGWNRSKQAIILFQETKLYIIQKSLNHIYINLHNAVKKRNKSTSKLRINIWKN